VRTRMSRLALAAGAAAVSLMLVSAAPAGAVNNSKKPLSLAAAGSDTTYWMMKLIGGHYAASSANTLHDKITMIPPTVKSPFPASVTVPADWNTSAKTWNASTPPPDGSSAGIAALVADTTADIDWARSSRGPNPGETSTMNFWAYALGALDFVTFPGTNAPAKGLTQQQLINIYTCDPSTGAPFASDWSDVGGKPGAIIKYAPQPGSGTYSFFNSKLLNGSAIDKNCDQFHQSIFLQEHDARGVTNGSKHNAIFAYDWARFRAQKVGFEQNLTNGAVLGKFGVNTPVGPTTSNVNETANRFFGTRYVFNVVRKTNHPGQVGNQLNGVTRLIGVRTAKQGGAQYICSGKAKADITKAGFVPLPKFGTGGTGLPSSFCRLNPKPL
jgi:ABC-type phosphate transport system substrate-binding protein